MRLWNYELIKNNLLPNSQAVAQWRELNSIFRKQDNHILINYIYNYNKETLKNYTKLVVLDLWDRDYNIRDYKNTDTHFECYNLYSGNSNRIYIYEKEVQE